MTKDLVLVNLYDRGLRQFDNFLFAIFKREELIKTAKWLLQAHKRLQGVDEVDPLTGVILRTENPLVMFEYAPALSEVVPAPEKLRESMIGVSEETKNRILELVEQHRLALPVALTHMTYYPEFSTNGIIGIEAESEYNNLATIYVDKDYFMRWIGGDANENQ